jgi:hypothetical protein
MTGTQKERLLGGTAKEVAQPLFELEGKTVSLNFMKRSFFKMPGSDFELNKAKPSGVLPTQLNEWQLKQVKNAVRFGELVVGNEPVYEPKKQSAALDPYFALLRTPNMAFGALESMIQGIVRIPDNDPRLGGYSRYVILEKLFREETVQSARKDVLELLTRAMEYVPGPTSPVDQPGPIVAPTSGATTSANTAIATDPTSEDLGQI